MIKSTYARFILILSVVSILLFSCNDSELAEIERNEVEKCGELNVTESGSKWTASPLKVTEFEDGKLSISLRKFNSQGQRRADLRFGFFEKVIGIKQEVHAYSTNTFGEELYSSLRIYHGDGDAIGRGYDLNESNPDNFFIIDSKSNEYLWGRFQVELISPAYISLDSDTMNFEKGSFKACW